MKKTGIKKPLGVALAIALSMLAVGCGGKDKSSSAQPATSSTSVASASESKGAASGSSSLQDISQSGSAAPASVAPPQPIAMDGTFVHLNEERFPEERAPLLQLAPDGTFSLRLNLSDGLGNMTGTYERLGTQLTLTIAVQETTDYLGAEILTLPFTVLEEDHLRYTGAQIGMTRPDDVFTREGMPAYVPPISVAPDPAASTTPPTAESGVLPDSNTPSTPVSSPAAASK